MLKTAGTLAVAALLALSPGAAAAKKPVKKTTHTAAGMATATRALLVLNDLGTGWTAGKPAPKDETLTCGSSTARPGVVETGTAASPTFQQSAAGPFVSQAVFVYATAAQAQRSWRLTAGKAVLDCLASSVAGGSTKGVKFTVVRKQTLASPAAGERSAAYRVVAHAHSTAQTVSAYVDLVLVGRGNALTEISYAAFSQPVDRSVELAIARALARRL